MPGGTSLDWTPPATYIHHKDWLGSSRITTVAGLVYTDKAFGAFGEDTAQDFGPAVNFDYAGDTQDIATAVYDTPNREYMPYQGRWPNADPSHSGWNGYAYAGNNPISFTDPSGLYWMVDEGADCIGNGCSTMGGFNFGGGFGSNGWAGSVINLLGGNWVQGLEDAASVGPDYIAESVNYGNTALLTGNVGDNLISGIGHNSDGMLVLWDDVYAALDALGVPYSLDTFQSFSGGSGAANTGTIAPLTGQRYYDALNSYCSARGRAKFVADWLPGGGTITRDLWNSPTGDALGFYQLPTADINNITAENSGGQTVAMHAASEGLQTAAGSTAFLYGLRANTGVPMTVAGTWLGRLSVAVLVADAASGFYKEGQEILNCQAGH
jgi:RHS repeat-associated protein